MVIKNKLNTTEEIHSEEGMVDKIMVLWLYGSMAYVRRKKIDSRSPKHTATNPYSHLTEQLENIVTENKYH
jgi:glutamyl/glutaminyl-tRNA synthetase